MNDGVRMDLQTALRHMIAQSGKPYAQVSREIGRNDRYVSIMLNDGTTPRTDLLAKIANACGYDVLLVGHGEALEITAELTNDSPVTARRSHRVTETDAGRFELIPEVRDRGWSFGWENEITTTSE